MTAEVDEKLKEICVSIDLRYEIEFLEIGSDSDHVHSFVRSVPTLEFSKDCADNQVNDCERNLPATALVEKAVVGR